MIEFCITCEHSEDEHDTQLGFCTVPHCPCLRFSDGTDEDEIQEMDFDQDAER